MRLADPWWLLVALCLIPLWVIGRRYARQGGVRFPSGALAGLIRRSLFVRLVHLPLVLRTLALLFLAFSLARPIESSGQVQKFSEGLDIMLVLDASTSMEAQDFVIEKQRHTRLQVVKKVIADFIKERSGDRLGMVIFGSEAYTYAPLTVDHNLVLSQLEQVESGMAGGATAIGDGLAVALSRLKDLEGKSKIVILLTDGANNAGRVDPLSAAKAAKALGIKLYVIGAGSREVVPIMINGNLYHDKVDIDEDLMTEMATMTGGHYYRATDTESLINIYKTIDQLEKRKLTITKYENQQELFYGFVMMALLFLLLEMGLGLTRLRKVP